MSIFAVDTPSDDPAFLHALYAERVNWLGPGVVGGFIQALETGIIVVQLIYFWARAERESALVRWIVSWVALVAFFQTGTAFYSLWSVYVGHFGQITIAMIPSWPEQIHPLITALMATPIQAFLLWRCWIIIGRKWYYIAPLTVVLLGSVIASAVIVSETLAVDFAALASMPMLQTQHIPVLPAFILSLVFPAFLDVLITGILITYLVRSRSSAHTRRFRRVLFRLMVITWEAAVPPAACAICAVVSYLWLLNRNKSFWDIMFQAILGKLYIISFLVTLIGRASLAEPSQTLTHFPTLTGAQDTTVLRASLGMEEQQQSHRYHVTISTVTAPPGARVIPSSTPSRGHVSSKS